ncbi:LacI family DNA-binding transcriptional regulator [Bifidobacterium sp. ESL0690]|uniref:LacI family DNA-binding transcriptional regulator n=1 Tax=Bifidobacterium sp. ESL0690 TaxID=2983214 RepID=UPI0023F6EFD1|nr:LacI family DNA-binding transcriptional regulator [Bifidobacterium sp. ESL0690]WEV46434.1 LacI family DNA-binding transcriptional regulator [Bifidobacterium sp. ESL0690]
MSAQRNSGKRPSMFEVAKMAGVSHQTVSRVINHSSEVSDATRTRVQHAIDVLGYRPSNSARTLASHRSRTIGLIAGGLNFLGPISAIGAIETIVRRHGLFLMVSMVHEARCTQSEFENLCRTFEEQNVDAFIFLTPTDIMFSAACRTKLPEPRVLITSTHGNLSMSRAGGLMDAEGRGRTALVGIDQWGAMHEVARLIARFGHRSALYFVGPVQWRDAVTRLLGWRKAAKQYHIDSREIQCNSWDSSEAYARMNHELESLGSAGAEKPTVIVTANDAQAIGVTRALHEHGFRIPQDVSVVGFDDMTGVNDMWPPLTTVRPDFEGLGTASMRETLRLLGEGLETTFAANAHGAGLIPAEVIQRHSLGPVPRL